MSKTSPETETVRERIIALTHQILSPDFIPDEVEKFADQVLAMVAPTQQQPNARREGMVSAFNEVADYLQEQKLYAYAEHIRKRAVSLSSTLQGGNDA